MMMCPLRGRGDGVGGISSALEFFVDFFVDDCGYVFITAKLIKWLKKSCFCTKSYILLS